MAAKKGGLGRGLSSLFEETTASGGESTATLRIADISPDREQPRKSFDDEALSELAASIEKHGVLQPIVVRPVPVGGYKIVAGERRWRAARLAGLKEIPAVVREISDNEAMELALIENLQREDLDPVEEALGYRQLMEKCNYTQETAAKTIGKSRSAVANSLRLLKLPPEALEFLRKGMLTAGHAKAILSIEDPALQLEAAMRIAQTGMSVRDAEALCRRLAKGPRKKKEVLPPALPAEVELSLREATGNEVRVQYKEGKGVLHVHFYSDDQLRAFANLLGNYKKEGI